MLSAVVLLTGAAPLHADDSQPRELSVSTAPPVVTIERRPPGRYFLTLPNLEYVFDIETRCSAGEEPQSLLISIADSRQTLGAAELADGAGHEVQVKVPARQIAPIAISGVCIAPADDPQSAGTASAAVNSAPAARDRLTVDAALSAQLSLLCRSETGGDMVYVARPLAVTLSCELPAVGAAQSAPGDR